jgi:hypothetical protein
MFFLHKFSRNFYQPVAIFLRWNSIKEFILRLEITGRGAHLSVTVSLCRARSSEVVSHLDTMRRPLAEALKAGRSLSLGATAVSTGTSRHRRPERRAEQE